MPKAAFVVFSKERGNTPAAFLAELGFLKGRIGHRAFNALYKRKIIGGARRPDMMPVGSVLAVPLPFPVSHARYFDCGLIERIILDICAAERCDGYFVPAEAKKGGRFGLSTDIGAMGALIFRALFLPVLREIFAGTDVWPDNVEIAFVHCGERNLLPRLAEIIEPYVKYIQVASTDVKMAEELLSGICRESGMAAQVSGDFKKVLKNAGLVIYLGGDHEMPACRVLPSTVVIDYSDGGVSGLHGDFPLVTGVMYDFPENRYLELGERILDNYGRAELAVMLMALKTGFICGMKADSREADAAARIFSAEKCRIRGFIGRRGFICTRDIQKCIKM